MARIIGTERVAGSDDSSGGGTGSGMRSGGRSGGRKLSFKTRGPHGGSQATHGRTIRATKVTVPASKVRELASKFNAVIVDREIDSQLSSHNGHHNDVVDEPAASRTSSTPPIVSSSVVLATIQRFEGIMLDHKGPRAGDRHKRVLVRTNSRAKEIAIEKLKKIPETVPEEEKKTFPDETTSTNRPELMKRLQDSSVVQEPANNAPPDGANEVNVPLVVSSTSSSPMKTSVKEVRPEIKPKPPDLTNFRGSLGNLSKISYKESKRFEGYSKRHSTETKRLSLPKVPLLDALLTDKKNQTAETSFLWKRKAGVDGESKKPGDEFKIPDEPRKLKVDSENLDSDPMILQVETKKPGVVANNQEEESRKTDVELEKLNTDVNGPELEPRRIETLGDSNNPIEDNVNTFKVITELPCTKIEKSNSTVSCTGPDTSEKPIDLTNLIANQSSLYRQLARSQENVSSLRRSHESISSGLERSRESVASVGHVSQEPPPVRSRIRKHQEDTFGSQNSLGSQETVKTSQEAIKDREPLVGAAARVSFSLPPGRPERDGADGTKVKKIQRAPSIRSNASYEDIGPSTRTYEDLTENNYAVIAEYDDSEPVYDDVLNIAPQAGEGIYESIYSGLPKDDSDSSLEHQNSLYDHRPASQASSGSGGQQSAAAKSDTSDEWIDIELEDKDRKEEFILLEEKSKPKNIHDSWSQRVRRQWSHKIAEEFMSSRGEPSEDVYEAPYDESAILDDFDDSSDSDGEGGGRSGGFDLIHNDNAVSSSPPQSGGSGRESEGIYGFMMSAGKKVKKTSWSISQRLRRRMSKISISVTNGTAEPVNGGLESGNQKRWPSFKKKAKGSSSKFYLEPAASPTPDASPGATATPAVPSPPLSTASLPLVLPPFKEAKRPSLDLPSSTPPPKDAKRSSLDLPASSPPNSSSSLPLVLPPVRDPPRRPSPPLLPPPPSARSSPPSSIDIRRLSTALPAAPRPTSPPPPPPPLVNGESKSATKSVNDPTLYLESGLFGQAHAQNGSMHNNETNSNHSGSSGKSQSNSQWYSDVGLYENTSENDSGHSSQLDLQFADEPLYQFYAARVAELEQIENNSDIGYEEIGPNSESSTTEIYSPSNGSVGSTGSGGVRPSALELVSPESIHRTLWCQVPQVINSRILESLTANQKRLQEAKFELITSEASYYKSLTVLERTFANSPAFKDELVIPKVDYKTLFGNIGPVRQCSESMLAGLEKCWQESILLDGICDVILEIANEKFKAYKRYCSHQVAIERTLKRLKKNPVFLEKLAALESSPACHSLSLSSFLLLPMQRVTRLPLLMDAIMTKLEIGSSEFQSCQAALLALNKVVHDCNEAARTTERLEEMGALSRAIVFPKHIRPLPLMSASRWLVRSGQVIQYNLDTKLTFSKKLTAPRPTKLTLFLFTDLFFITKKKSDESFTVLTYCQRNFVQMSAEEDPLALPGSTPTRFLLSITILENHERKTQEMMVCCNSESCRERWLQPFSRPTSEDPDQVLYETWDCPQVVASHSYPSTQPDELSLQPGDVVNVLTKMADGWFYGERLRDSEKGWFPGNHVTEVASAHVRARNLRQRHRLLALSSTIIQQRQLQT
uniref:Rho guanine nucleotide exchange factor 16 n=1 Tax=Lygus hesperus TaxID=30085 RepID=A0A0A9VXD6_LYGHE